MVKQYSIYETSDGNTFQTRHEAELHEAVLKLKDFYDMCVKYKIDSEGFVSKLKNYKNDLMVVLDIDN